MAEPKEVHLEFHWAPTDFTVTGAHKTLAMQQLCVRARTKHSASRDNQWEMGGINFYNINNIKFEVPKY